MPLAKVGPRAVPGWAAYPAGVAWALGLAGPSAAAAGASGVSLYINSVVPTGSGLSSSAALECAVALALHDLHGLQATRAELALACQRAENEVVGAPTGIMDQFASLFGEHGSAVFIDCRTVHGENVPLALEAAGLRSCWPTRGSSTRTRRAATSTAGRRATGPRASSASGRCATSASATSTRRRTCSTPRRSGGSGTW